MRLESAVDDWVEYPAFTLDGDGNIHSGELVVIWQGAIPVEGGIRSNQLNRLTSQPTIDGITNEQQVVRNQPWLSTHKDNR